jgi:hypothetical protein
MTTFPAVIGISSPEEPLPTNAEIQLLSAVLTGDDSTLPLLLGQGVQPLTLEAKGFPVDLGELESQSGNEPLAGRTLFRYLEISSLTELRTELNISASLSLKSSLFGGFRSSFSLQNKFHKNSSYRFVLIEVTVANELELASSFTYKPEVQDFLKNPNFNQEDFVRNFGTEFVHGRRTGGRLYALVEFEFIEEGRESELDAALQANGNVFFRGRAEFREKLEQLNVSSRTRIEILKIGGRPGLPNFDGITDFALKFDTLVSDFGDPITLELISKDYAGVQPLDLRPNIQSLLSQQLVLEEIAENVELAQTSLNSIKFVKQNIAKFKVDEQQINSLNNSENALIEFINVQSDAAVICFENINECKLPERRPLPTVILPERKKEEAAVIVTIGGSGDRVHPLGVFAGSRNENTQVERLLLTNTGIDGVRFRYFAHLQNIGDTEFVDEGNFVGTRNEDRRLEGFAIELTGPDANNFDVFYMAFLGVSTFGIQGGIGETRIFSNGEFCGTRREGRILSGLKVFIQRRG